MKQKIVTVCLLGVGLLLLSGCIAFPPLVQVEHKHAAPAADNQEVLRRLDAIDHRLDQLEAKAK
jgi:hypothetical protein